MEIWLPGSDILGKSPILVVDDSGRVAINSKKLTNNECHELWTMEGPCSYSHIWHITSGFWFNIQTDFKLAHVSILIFFSLVTLPTDWINIDTISILLSTKLWGYLYWLQVKLEITAWILESFAFRFPLSMTLIPNGEYWICQEFMLKWTLRKGQHSYFRFPFHFAMQVFLKKVMLIFWIAVKAGQKIQKAKLGR